MSNDVIRTLNPADIATLIGRARDEGWNPGLDDAAPFHAADPDGFIGCFINGVMAAGLSAVRYGADFGFIGLYIAHPGFRGKGYGRQVWDAGMAHLANRTIGLDGVPEQQSTYRAMGFLPAYETLRWSGRFFGSNDPEVVPVTPALFPGITAYDRQFFPAVRASFLAEWLSPPRRAFAILREGEIHGLAVIRQCQGGFKVGPLLAESVEDAAKLLATCALQAKDEMIHIDVPAGQKAFTALLQSQGFTKGFVTARMYRGNAPAVRSHGLFGITTLELG